MFHGRFSIVAQCTITMYTLLPLYINQQRLITAYGVEHHRYSIDYGGHSCVLQVQSKCHTSSCDANNKRNSTHFPSPLPSSGKSTPNAGYSARAAVSSPPVMDVISCWIQWWVTDVTCWTLDVTSCWIVDVILLHIARVRINRVRLPIVLCVFSSHSFWTSMDVPAGVTQEEGNIGFSIHLLSAVLALIFFARRIQPFLSLVDREVEFCVPTI